MIKYLGSKRRLLPQILAAVQSARSSGTVLDLFSGTARVGHALKQAGYRVLANDYNAYAAALARCYVEADAEEVGEPARQLIDEFNRLPGEPGYFTETFCIRSRFFQPQNGARIDAIREAIAEKSLPSDLEAVLLVSLMEAADRVDSTTGVQMAYLKSWAPRAASPLTLRLPAILPRAASGKGRAFMGEALEVAGRLEADVAYLDPPYNQHSYLGNYHIWESLVCWDKPAVYGVACKRMDCRARKSVYNQRSNVTANLERLLQTVNAETVVVSFNNEGYVQQSDLERMLAGREHGTAHLQVYSIEYPRYVGAQIGIYSPTGQKVGRVGHLKNKELLFIASRRPLPPPALLSTLAARV